MPILSPIAILGITLIAVFSGGVLTLIFYALHLEHKLKDTEHDLEAVKKSLKNSEWELSHAKEADAMYELYRSIFSQLQAGVVLIDRAGKIMDFNTATQRLTGLMSSDCRGETYQKIFQIETNGDTNIAQAIGKSLEGTICSLPKWTTITTPAGKKRVIGAASPLTGKNGPLGSLLILWDGTQFYTDDQRAQETNTRLIQTIESLKQEKLDQKMLDTRDRLSGVALHEASEAIVALDTTGAITLINPCAARLAGCETEDVTGKNYKEVVHLTGDEGETAYASIESALSGKAQNFKQWTYITTQNEKIPITGIASPIRTKEGNQGASVIFRDATEDFKREEEEKSFFSAAAHDLRSPLTTMRAVYELLLDTYDNIPPEKIKDMLKGVNQSVLHLIDLVNDLLDVSRIEQNRLVLSREIFDLPTLTKQIMASQQIIAKERKLFITQQESDNELRKVLADKGKTQEVLINLLSNALKYTYQGGVTITHHMEDNKVITTIQDTGMGISKENIPLLFRKFQQISTARNMSSTKSTGLGLYISKRFCQLMGGDLVLVRSEPGVGSTFSFWLPAA
jgi:PAS domain S-box-containing protein